MLEGMADDECERTRVVHSRTEGNLERRDKRKDQKAQVHLPNKGEPFILIMSPAKERIKLPGGNGEQL